MITYRLGNPLVRKRIKLEYHACRKSTDCDLCDSLADIAGVENVQEACIYKIQREQFFLSHGVNPNVNVEKTANTSAHSRKALATTYRQLALSTSI